MNEDRTTPATQEPAPEAAPDAAERPQMPAEAPAPAAEAPAPAAEAPAPAAEVPAPDAAERPQMPAEAAVEDLPSAPGRAPRSLTRCLVGTVLPVVLVLGAVGGGAGFIKVTVDRADRTAPTQVWQKPDSAQAVPDPAAESGRGRTDTPLSRKLLPVPSSYRLGPDIGEYGNDGELSGREASSLIKALGQGLSGGERRAMEKQIDKLGITGVAVRSYVSTTNDLVIETHLTQIKDRKAVIDFYRAASSLPGVRKGPAVKGHKHATCFLSKKDKSDKSGLAEMVCVAYDGDLSVQVNAVGTDPVDASAVAELLGDQLDHIASPGKYV
ncbi:hypothetical protein [Streptomyces sp. NPDC051569]|uniref:hypothetical protein n=1 Tax=Streptomyces sp. NPDC051569 TaxID=3365661 RepID=UPI00379E6B57